MHPDSLKRVREAFAAADYTEPAISKRLDTTEFRTMRFDRRKYPALIRRTNGGSKLDTLIQTFLLGGIADRDTFAAAVGDVQPFLDAGLVADTDGKLRARYRVTVLDHLLLPLDPPWSLPEDVTLQIMPPSSSSFSLTQITIRRPVASALDLGTGCGLQALYLAGHAQHVVATDRNPRAVELTKFNAALNGLTVECHAGDWFEPVAGRTFDLIVGNLPYVVSPGEKFMYRDSGHPGDWVSRQVVTSAPAYLKAGGYAQFLINWVQRRGEDWRKRFQSEWLDGTGCDAWVFTSQKHDPITYTLTWLPDEPVPDPERYDRRFAEWLDFFERENVESIYSGSIVVRKRTGANWLRHDDSPQLSGDCGEAIVRGFEIFDGLFGKSDDHLLAMRWRPSPELRGLQTLAPTGGGWQVTSATLRLEKGLAFAGTVDRNLLALVTRIAPDRTLAEALTEVAKGWQKEPATVVQSAMPLLRELMLQGMLLPAT